MQQLAKEQEVLMNIADMMMETYIAESTLLRIQKLGENATEEQIAMMKVYLYDAADRIGKAGRDAIQSFADGDELRAMMMGMKRFTKHEPFNVKEHRRVVAAKLIDKNEYCF